MRVCGKMICSMDKEQRDGLMVHHILASMTMAKNRVQDYTNGMMVQNTVENGTTIKSVVL